MKMSKHRYLLLPAALSFIVAFPLSAQLTTTVITSDTSITQTRVNGVLREYQVADDATFTIQAAGVQASGGGGLFNLSSAGNTLIIGPSGTGATGRTVITGYYTQAAGGNGGAVNSTLATTTITLTNLSFVNNSAGASGGAIRNMGAMTLTNVNFDNNKAGLNTTAGGRDGGAIQNLGVMNMTGGAFTNNYAFVSGGALQNTNAGAIANLTGVVFTGNRAGGNGGALAQTTDAALVLTNVVFRDNWAAGMGGALSDGVNTGATPTMLRFTGANGATEYHYTGNFAGGNAVAATTDALESGVANFSASAAAGGFYYQDYTTPGATMTFDIASGVSLTIGDASAADRAYDSIASASDTASIKKTGGGLMVLNADNSYYSGTFAVYGGKLLLGNAGATLGGNVVVASGATFGGAGTLTTSGAFAGATTLTAGAGATIQVGLRNAQSLAINGLADFQDGATLAYDLFAGNNSGFLDVTSGTLNWAGTGTINLLSLVSGTFTLAQWGAGNLADASSLSLISGGAALDAARGSGVLSVNSQKLVLEATFFSLSGTWAGTAGGTWSAGGSGWDTSTTDTFFHNGDSVSFISGGSLNVAGSVTASEMNVSGAGNLVIAGEGGITTDAASVLPGSTAVTGASGALVKNGAGTLTLANTGANTFTGGVQINGGAVAFASADQLGLGVTPANVTFANTSTLAALAGASGTIRGDLVLDAITTDATFDAGNGAGVTFVGVLRGPAGTFTKTGAGALTLSGNSSAFTGATRVNGGSLLLAPGAILGGGITAASGGIIGGAGTLSDTVTLSAGGAVQAGLANAPGSLEITVNNLQLGDGAMLNFLLFSGNANPSLSVNSHLNVGTLGFVGAGVTGSNIIINLNDVYDGSFDIATFNSYSAAALEDFAEAHVKLNDRELTSREIVVPVVSGGTLSLIINKGNQRVFWTGVTDSAWAADNNWRNTDIPLPFADGDIVVFDGSDTAGRRDIFVEGTQVRVSGMEVVGSGNYRFTGGALVIDAASANGIDGTGQLLVNTTGTLALANNGTNVFLQGIRLVNGTLVPETDGALGGATTTLTVAGNGTLQLVASGTEPRSIIQPAHVENDAVLTIEISAIGGNMLGAITSAGNGSLVKTGLGALGLDTVNVSTLTVEQGAVTFRPDIPLVAREAVNIQSAGSIVATSGTIQTPLLVNQGSIALGRAAVPANPFGSLTIDGNYKGNGGVILITAANTAGSLMSDQLIITGTLQGALHVTFSGSAPTPFPTDYDWSWQPVVADAIDPDATIDPRSSMLRDAYWYYVGALTINPDGTINYQKVIAPEIPPLIAVDAASLLIGKASLDSIARRFTTLRQDYHTGFANAWISGLYRADRLSTSIYDGVKSDTAGVQAGMDWTMGDNGRLFTLGAFVDYAKNDMDCPQPTGMTNATTKATGFGLYLGHQRNKFYWEAIARMADEDYDMTTPGSGTFGTSGKSVAASLAAGYIVSNIAKWNLEPQARLAWQTHKIDNVTDPVGRHYDISRADSLEAQAALRVSQSFEWRKDLRMTPYVRAGVTREFKGKTKVTVAGETFENNLADTGGLLEAGALMQLGKGAYAAASLAWNKTRKLESYSLDATVGLRW